mgnify:CR=1 FL=1
MINADLLSTVEATVNLGADPTKARGWWLGEISRIANEKDTSVVSLSITPKDVAEIVELINKGELTDKLARQVVEGVIAGEGKPSEVVAQNKHQMKGIAVWAMPFFIASLSNTKSSRRIWDREFTPMDSN